MEFPVEVFQRFVDVLVGALHRCEALAFSLARDSAHARRSRRIRYSPGMNDRTVAVPLPIDLGQVPRRPRKIGQPASASFSSSGSSRLINGVRNPTRTWSVEKEVEFGGVTLTAVASRTHEDLPDEGGDGPDGARHGEESDQRQA